MINNKINDQDIDNKKECFAACDKNQTRSLKFQEKRSYNIKMLLLM